MRFLTVSLLCAKWQGREFSTPSRTSTAPSMAAGPKSRSSTTLPAPNSSLPAPSSVSAAWFRCGHQSRAHVSPPPKLSSSQASSLTRGPQNVYNPEFYVAEYDLTNLQTGERVRANGRFADIVTALPGFTADLMGRTGAEPHNPHPRSPRYRLQEYFCRPHFEKKSSLARDRLPTLLWSFNPRLRGSLAAVLDERQPVHCVSIPGESPWAKEALRGPGAPAAPATMSERNNKRAHEEGEEMDVEEVAGEGVKKIRQEAAGSSKPSAARPNVLKEGEHVAIVKVRAVSSEHPSSLATHRHTHTCTNTQTCI